ncbi:MAG: type VI secretion system baseplate subunit TssF [Pseudomonadota bacterium]
MDDLLPHYERELGFLRRHSREFAERYPKIAGRLLMGGEVCEDPHIESMIQAFALLNSRIARRLDDDYPEFTEALLEVLYPHYLRPIPACSIAHFRLDKNIAKKSAASEVARGTELSTREVKGVTCTFRTVYPVTVAPITLSRAVFSAIVAAPSAVQLPPTVTSSISIRIDSLAQKAGLDQLCVASLRVFIDGEPAFCSTLRDAMFMRTVQAYVEQDQDGRWIALEHSPIGEVGFDNDDAMIEFPAKAHSAHRLLTEYFCYPEKFNFFDIDLAALTARLPKGCRQLSLHLALSGLRTDSAASRMLSTLTSANLALGCTPVINLFARHGDPIHLSHAGAGASYPVLVNGAHAYGYEVQSINTVKLVRLTPGSDPADIRPLYSLRHGESPAGHYWMLRRDQDVARKNPGLEAFRDMLAMYDLPRSPISQRQIGGITGIERKLANAWLPGDPFPSLVRGLDVRLTIEEAAFVGSGMHAFARIVERFLGLYVHSNSFTRLALVSHKTGEQLLRCEPRRGDLSLV